MRNQLLLLGFIAFISSTKAQAQLASEKPLSKAYGRQVTQVPAATRPSLAPKAVKLPSEALPPRGKKAEPMQQTPARPALLPSERKETIPPYRKPAVGRG